MSRLPTTPPGGHSPASRTKSPGRGYNQAVERTAPARTLAIAVVAAAMWIGAPRLGPAAAATPASDPGVVLTGIAHALDGTTLVITGSVENRSGQALSRLVIDATGFGPSGDPAFFGSDGIPWDIAPHEAETFSIRLSLVDRPVRSYQVQVARVQQPRRPLASARRAVDSDFYRPLLLSIARLSGDLTLGILTVSADVRGWPVAQVTADVSVLITQPGGASRIETFKLDVTPGRPTRVGIGLHSALLSLRVVDVRPQSVWSD